MKEDRCPLAGAWRIPAGERYPAPSIKHLKFKVVKGNQVLCASFGPVNYSGSRLWRINEVCMAAALPALSIQD